MKYLDFVDSNLASLSWPIRVRSDVDENHDWIERSDTSDRKDDIHLRGVVTSNDLD